MSKIAAFLKKELMLTVSLLAAIISLLISPPSLSTVKNIDWHTLATLFMMLTVLEGFKSENIFNPVIRLSGKISTMTGISFFLVFGVFFSSMFVTNDVSLIIFVPLTIMLFRSAKKEEYILPVISMENIAAVRGSMLTPFGSPQNLFIFGKSGVSAFRFLLHMFPLWILSAVLLCLFIVFLYGKNLKQKIALSENAVLCEWQSKNRKKRIMYVVLFALIIFEIVSRTEYYWLILIAVLVSVLIFDRKILLKTDYVLILTFLCFFVFSSSVTSNATISSFLNKTVSGHEYISGILLSQVISNVPAAIVLYPFTKNLSALLYGVDSAGLCTLIGSLASVINYRIYVREYPNSGGKFIKTFTLISLTFFAFVVLPGYFLSFWQI
ncbi:MAG: citrate transporter [Clostridia bacterium]|nr:citrate transporter [Clostridia bacterium]